MEENIFEEYFTVGFSNDKIIQQQLLEDNLSKINNSLQAKEVDQVLNWDQHNNLKT